MRRRSPRSATGSSTTTSGAPPIAPATPRRSRTWSSRCSTSPTSSKLPLNLGGGLAAGDGLEAFKRGFANAELAFSTHEIVCDPDAYAELAGDRDAGDFFPAYRA